MFRGGINDDITEDSDIEDSDLVTVSYCGLQLGKIGRLRCGEGRIELLGGLEIMSTGLRLVLVRLRLTMSTF